MKLQSTELERGSRGDGLKLDLNYETCGLVAKAVLRLDARGEAEDGAVATHGMRVGESPRRTPGPGAASRWALARRNGRGGGGFTTV